MKETIQEWLDKAEEDWQALQILINVQPTLANVICFHAQQCAEKLMKGLLVKYCVQPPYTHDLVFLYKKLQPFYKDWNVTVDEIDYLSVAAVEFRYPGGDATYEDVDVCVETCTRIRSNLLMILKESTDS